MSAEIDLDARRFVCGYAFKGIGDAREARFRSLKLKVHEKLYRAARETIARREAAGIPGLYNYDGEPRNPQKR